MTILNLTLHPATPEQIAAGVVDLCGDQRNLLVALLTFDTLPTRAEVEQRADAIALIAANHTHPAAMIGGAPFLMAALVNALNAELIQALYAFSTRESVEKTLPDGGIEKTSVFRHAGFV